MYLGCVPAVTAERAARRVLGRVRALPAGDGCAKAPHAQAPRGPRLLRNCTKPKLFSSNQPDPSSAGCRTPARLSRSLLPRQPSPLRLCRAAVPTGQRGVRQRQTSARGAMFQRRSTERRLGGCTHLVTVELGDQQTFDPLEDQSPAQGRAEALRLPELSKTNWKCISAQRYTKPVLIYS